MHECRIAHTDFLEQNTGINILVDTDAEYPEGLRNPSVTHYAIYDFGASLIYPEDTVLEDVQSSGFFNFGLRGYETPPGPWNPFQVDILFLGCALERWVRVSRYYFMIEVLFYTEASPAYRGYCPCSRPFLRIDGDQ